MPNDGCSILISIHPNFISSMLDGSKLYEYRKKIPTNTKQLIIYATAPIQAIVAIAEVTEVLNEEPHRLWDKTKHGSGIKYDLFMKYFKNKEMGYALKLGQIRWFNSPVVLDQIKPNMRPPQSFQYTSSTQIEIVKRHGRSKSVYNQFLSRLLSGKENFPEANQFSEVML